MNTTKRRKTLTGIIVSDTMDKTIVVAVTRYVKHPKYKKYLKRVKRYKAHDAQNAYEVGQKVTIEECRPISKDKHFTVVGVN